MQTRHLTLTDLHTRETDDGDHLEFDGQAVPYNSPITYGGIEERFAAGAVDEADAVGRPILWGHDRQELIGSIQSARNTDDGLQVTGTIEATSRGRDVIQLMRKGHLRGLSIGFTPTETDRTPQGLTYTRAQLHELSLTPLPAYGDQSLVTATREEDTAMTESTETREAPVDLAPLTERLDQLEARMIDRTATEVREIAPVDALAMQLRDAVEAKKIRALGDVVSGGNAGVLPPTWSSLLRGYLDGNRYLTPRLGSLAFPATGHTLTVPAISQEPTVGPRGTELTAIPGTAMTTDSDTYTAKWIAGGVRVALELVSQSSPEASAVAVQRLLLAYSREAEDTIATDLTAAAVKTGAALDFTGYGTFVDSVLDAAHTIRDVTGAFGDKLALSAASWKSLIGLVDADGRRILSVSGPSNADGSGALTSTSVNVGGVECFYYLGSADLQFNTMSAAYAEKPPTTLSEVEVGVMGRSVGVLGAVIALPLYTDGLLNHAV